MTKIDNQPQKSRRDQLAERLAGKYPDKDFSDDEAFYGQISDDFDNYDNELNGYKEREKGLSDMFTSDPRSASFLTDWRKGEDPVVGLVRRFGPDIKDALEDPEQQEALAKASAQYYEQMTKANELNDAYAKNWPETMKRFDAAIEQGKLREDEVDDVFELLRKVVDDGIVGIISDEAIDMAVKSLRHDSDVADADHAGEVRGRNSRIKETLRKNSAGDGTAQLDGQNGKPGGGQHRRRDLGPLSDVGDGLQNIWERGDERRTRR